MKKISEMTCTEQLQVISKNERLLHECVEELNNGRREITFSNWLDGVDLYELPLCAPYETPEESILSIKENIRNIVDFAEFVLHKWVTDVHYLNLVGLRKAVRDFVELPCEDTRLDLIDAYLDELVKPEFEELDKRVEGLHEADPALLGLEDDENFDSRYLAKIGFYEMIYDEETNTLYQPCLKS